MSQRVDLFYRTYLNQNTESVSWTCKRSSWLLKKMILKGFFLCLVLSCELIRTPLMWRELELHNRSAYSFSVSCFLSFFAMLSLRTLGTSYSSMDMERARLPSSKEPAMHRTSYQSVKNFDSVARVFFLFTCWGRPAAIPASRRRQRTQLTQALDEEHKIGRELFGLRTKNCLQTLESIVLTKPTRRSKQIG